MFFNVCLKFISGTLLNDIFYKEISFKLKFSQLSKSGFTVKNVKSVVHIWN